jgi:hypothetical protein
MHETHAEHPRVRAYPVVRTSARAEANPWIGQNERRRIRLCWMSERQSAQTRRGSDRRGAGGSGSTTRVSSAYRVVIQPPPAPFQGAMVWPRSRQGGEPTGLARELLKLWVL